MPVLREPRCEICGSVYWACRCAELDDPVKHKYNDTLDILREVAQPLREALENCNDDEQSIIAGELLTDNIGNSIRVSDLRKILNHIYSEEDDFLSTWRGLPGDYGL